MTWDERNERVFGGASSSLTTLLLWEYVSPYAAWAWMAGLFVLGVAIGIYRMGMRRGTL
jgi:hypothetical protein